MGKREHDCSRFDTVALFHSLISSGGRSVVLSLRTAGSKVDTKERKGNEM